MLPVSGMEPGPSLVPRSVSGSSACARKRNIATAKDRQSDTPSTARPKLLVLMEITVPSFCKFEFSVGFGST